MPCWPSKTNSLDESAAPPGALARLELRARRLGAGRARDRLDRLSVRPLRPDQRGPCRLFTSPTSVSVQKVSPLTCLVHARGRSARDACLLPHQLPQPAGGGV